LSAISVEFERRLFDETRRYSQGILCGLDSFYRDAERDIATLMLSVRLSVCNAKVPGLCNFGYFEINYSDN